MSGEGGWFHLEDDLEKTEDGDLLAKLALVGHKRRLGIERVGVLIAQGVLEVQVAVVECDENLVEPRKRSSVERLDDGVRQQFREVVNLLAQKRRQRQIHRQILSKSSSGVSCHE